MTARTGRWGVEGGSEDRGWVTLGAQARLRDDYARWLTEVGANAANARNEAVRICIINSFDEAQRGEFCSRYDYFSNSNPLPKVKNQ